MARDDYLATGFRNVDRAGASGTYIECLSLLDSLPFYRDVKQHSYELMELGKAVSVLDAGCGLGYDAFRMAAQVARGAQVVGLDASTALIAQAGKDMRADELPISFCAGNLKALPFGDANFDRCRIDRVLQHVVGPDAALAELVRVLRPGGMVLAYDNDWDTFKISNDEALTRRVEATWRDAFANSTIGRDLPSLLEDAGLSHVDTMSHVSVIEDFQTADLVYNLAQTVGRLADAGEIVQDEADAWLAALDETTRDGSFTVELTAHTVVGVKGG